MELETLDRLKRARIQIQRSNPFFAYLSLYLKFREDKNKELPEWAGMGVSADGWLLYKKEFVDSLTENELVGVLIHEILHLSLLHLTRRGHRQFEIWNISADLAVNQIIKTNGYALPKGSLLSDYSNNFTINGHRIQQIDKKTAEQLYDEIEPLIKKGKGRKGRDGDIVINSGDGDGDDDDDNGKGMKRFDYHQEGKGDKQNKDKKNGKSGGNCEPLTDEEKREIEEYWKNKANEALVTAKLKGNVPAGIERLVGELSQAKVGWRELLQKYIQRAIPYDYTYANCSKKSVSTGVYMPNTIRDFIDVVVAIDTSGSIGQEELKDFLSEVIGISKAFSSRVRMRLLTHDVKVWDDLLIQNGNIEKIKNMNVRGGGGTSHKDVFDHVKENYRDTRLLVCFTDGDSDLDSIDGNEYRFDKVFVISVNGHDMQLKKWNTHVIKLGDYKY